jgi:hypothetical protein
MSLIQVLISVFKCWKSIVLTLLPFSIFAVLFSNLPFLSITLGLIHLDPAHQGLIFFMLFLGYTLYLIPAGAIIACINNLIHGRKPLTLKQGLQTSLSRFVKMFMTYIALCVVIALCFGSISLIAHFHPNFAIVSFFILGIILIPFVVTLFPIVIIDNAWPLTVSVIAYRLVNKNWLSVLGIIIVTYAVVALLMMLAFHFFVVALLLNLIAVPLMLSMSVIVTENLKLPE